MMNHRHVTLRQFRYFIAVAESGSVAAASRTLNIAQSAVTKAMLELEGELGNQLFERTSKGMMLTPQGHRFLPARARSSVRWPTLRGCTAATRPNVCPACSRSA